MFNIRNLSIKNKLIWVQVLTSVLVLTLCFIAFLITDIRGYKKRKKQSTISIAQVIGQNSISAIQFMDNDAATKFLDNLQKIEPDVINATIIDKSGKIFADYVKPGNKDYVFKPPFTDNYYEYTDDFLLVYKSIIKNGEFYGTVCMQVELTELSQIEAQLFQMTFVLFLTGVILSFIIAIINQNYISGPILLLIKMIQKIRESGEYSKHVPVSGKDESLII